MKRSSWLKTVVLCLASSMGSGVGAQTDTLQGRIFGAQRDDRGLRLLELEGGDVLSLSVSNSTTDDQPRAWVHRFDSTVQAVWETTVADAPLLQPVDAVEHGEGLITVLGMRYANVADAYDWGWYTLNAAGEQVGTAQWGTGAWDLPCRVLQRNDSLWTVGTTYASGGGDVVCTVHTWNDGAWTLAGQWAWDGGGEEAVEDAEFFGEALGVLSTVDTDAHANFTVFDALTGAVQWTYATSFDSPTEAQALAVRDSTAALLVNADTPDGWRIGFACLSLEGDTLLEAIPGSGVDVKGRDMVWYGPSNFATLSVTEDLGLGGEEWLYSRWTDQGAWQGGPTFGTPWDEVPEAMLYAGNGRLWMLGSTDGYSNGRDDVYLLVVPSPGVGNNNYVTVNETHITEEAVTVEESRPSHDFIVYPNPVRDVFALSGAAPSATWCLFDGSGRTALSGRGATGDVAGLADGLYFLQVQGANGLPSTIPLCVQR